MSLSSHTATDPERWHFDVGVCGIARGSKHIRLYLGEFGMKLGSISEHESANLGPSWDCIMKNLEVENLVTISP
jgi:hypothetical protein